MPLPIYKQPNEGEEEMKKGWVRHEKLCAQLEACSLDLKQNEAQMSILTATGAELKEKHKKIRGLLDEAKANEELEKLSKEIENVETQTRIWLNELHDVHDKRVDIDCQMIRLGSEVKKNETYVQLACIDIERMEIRHEIRWKKFLQNSPCK
ncbi:Protein CBG12258 [Caenorhabditis briggsae]|uniref:Protein CBG12258 n=1 Tax=Caenorhabditis briggsae TaxID=6238 RepID=A8XF41_CAEBR|nr:Protein CBG12258 [Caenorhabditis briggsae]CAP31263.2 Protein CBG12258 [Caenorhabditis briggsae]